MLGNTSVTSVRAAGSFVIYSDGRFKSDVRGDVPGLAFINSLKLVTYHYMIHDLNNHIKPAQKESVGRASAREVSQQANAAEEQAIRAKE